MFKKALIITLIIVIIIPISFVLGGLTAIIISGGVSTTYKGKKGKLMRNAPQVRVIKHSPMGLKYYLRKFNRKVK